MVASSGWICASGRDSREITMMRMVAKDLYTTTTWIVRCYYFLPCEQTLQLKLVQGYPERVKTCSLWPTGFFQKAGVSTAPRLVSKSLQHTFASRGPLAMVISPRLVNGPLWLIRSFLAVAHLQYTRALVWYIWRSRRREERDDEVLSAPREGVAHGCFCQGHRIISCRHPPPMCP